MDNCGKVIEVTKSQYDSIKKAFAGRVGHRRQDDKYLIYIMMTGGKSEREVMKFVKENG